MRLGRRSFSIRSGHSGHAPHAALRHAAADEGDVARRGRFLALAENLCRHEGSAQSTWEEPHCADGKRGSRERVEFGYVGLTQLKNGRCCWAVARRAARPRMHDRAAVEKAIVFTSTPIERDRRIKSLGFFIQNSSLCW